MSLTEMNDTEETVKPGRARMSVARAVIFGALIIALGTFVTNTVHDVKENGEAAVQRAHAAACRHWEEKARVVAYGQAELYRQKLGFNTADPRVQPEYWVSLDKVQKWYPVSATDAGGARVDRPSYC